MKILEDLKIYDTFELFKKHQPKSKNKEYGPFQVEGKIFQYVYQVYDAFK